EFRGIPPRKTVRGIGRPQRGDGPGAETPGASGRPRRKVNMLVRTTTSMPCGAVKAPPRQITGRNIAHVVRNAQQRAVLGAELLQGEAVLVKPTLLQVAELVGVCPAYVRIAYRLNPAERFLVITSGRSLLDPPPNPVTDANLDRLARIDNGARLWAALERA